MTRTEFLIQILRDPQYVDMARAGGVWLGFGDDIWAFNWYERQEIIDYVFS